MKITLSTLTSLLLVTSVDQPSRDSQVAYQNLLMLRTVGIYGTDDVRQSLRNDGLLKDTTNPNDACTWKCVTCVDRLIHAITWIGNGSLVLEWFIWLPSTLRKVHLEQLKVKDTVDTRRLPRDLVYLYACKCGLRGTVDMRHLPQHTEEVHLRQNFLTGNICLTSLPQSMRCLDLVHNDIAKVIVSNASLPKAFQLAHFYRPVETLPIIVIDGKEADQRVLVSAGSIPSHYIGECAVAVYEFGDVFMNDRYNTGYPENVL